MIRLHHVAGSRSMRVLWLLRELELEFEVVEWPLDATLRGAAFAVINPLGRVPVLEIGGETMTESGAMIEYLCDRYPQGGLGRGPGDPDRADWLQWLHFAETVSGPATVLSGRRGGAEHPPEAWRAAEATRLARCLQVIEARLSTRIENRDHLLTSGFSAADIAVGQAVWMARAAMPPEPGSELAAWLDRITARPAFALAAP